MVNKKRKYRDIKFNTLIVNIDIIGCSAHLRTGNNKTIGSCIWEIENKKDMYISDFGIEDKYQGKGYGNFLARVVIDLAKLYHLKSVYLTDGAIPEGFWQRLGFKTKFLYKNKVKVDTGYVELKL